MTKTRQPVEEADQLNDQPKKAVGTIKLKSSKFRLIPGEKYDTYMLDLDGENKKEIEDAFEVVVKAYLKDRSALHTFELSGSTEETFDGFIINFSPYTVSLIRYK